ncbi:hypothetical protein LEP1GSC086_2292 [Leptospira weilii str. LNT 1234]|nr:hypothetical protein LEP1GSC086_2292 [Leptospira weilii str. LNT 1234]
MGRSFHRGFVVIPTDLSSDPSNCGALRKYGILVSYSPKLSYAEFTLI